MRLRLTRMTFLLIFIIVLASFLRLYGIDWDQGHHLHPDERAIVMFTTPLHFPQSVNEFLSPTSPWNPHFFAYGNFPLYLLKATASILANFDPLYLSYEKINLVGRSISAIADIGTLILLYFLAKKLFNQTIGLVAAFFYTISVFPIQAAHFFAVDTLLTFFITLTLYQLVRFYEKPSISSSILVGVFFGLSLATKTSATPLVIAILLAIAVDFILLVLKQPHKPHIWFPHVPRFLKRLIFDGVTISVSTLLSFALLQPYALIDFQEFLKQNLLQAQMTRDAFTFPYTLQYVGKIPYFYEIKNIFLWGQGPILATLSFLGTVYIGIITLKKMSLRGPRAHRGGQSNPQSQEIASLISFARNDKNGKNASFQTDSKWAQELILFIFFIAYFLIVGRFAIGFMRYLLPIYPLLAFFAAIFAWRLYILIKDKLKMPTPLFIILNSLFIILVFVWPLSFMHIYTQPNTRVLASQWIYQNIPADKTIAREHWDDGMPIGGNIAYKTLELPIYEMENPLREAQIYQMVQQSDYIILASNRLYVPLQKLSKNCQKWNLPPERCSHNANRYYEKLFTGELGYKKVAEFSVFPKLEVSSLRLEVDDSSADESFTVYDHPKVMIFEKI